MRWNDPEFLGALSGIVFGVFVCGLLWLASRRPRVGPWTVRLGSRLRDSEEIADDVHRLFGLRRDAGIRGHFHGALDGGRQVHLDLEQPSSDGPARGVFRVATGPVPAIKIVQETDETARARLDGSRREIEIGAQWFDRRYFIETRDRDAAARVARPFLDGFKDLVDDAFLTHGVDAIELADSELRACFPLSNDLPSYANLLPLLERAARFFDRVNVRVLALGADRRALRGAGGEARCSYCHEHVTGEEPDLVACERCATVLHGACWNEHGRCPVLGCGGAVPERARAS